MDSILLLLLLAALPLLCLPAPTEPPYLRGVPEELRDKILAFHRVLNTPDNFSAAAAPAPRSFGGVGLQEAGRGGVAGLQEASEEDEARRQEEARLHKGELQDDLFRFSSKVSVPHSVHTGLGPNRQNFVNFMRRKERLRSRIQKVFMINTQGHLFRSAKYTF